MWAWKKRDTIDVHPWLPPDLAKVQENVNATHRRTDEMLENKVEDWLLSAPAWGFELAAAALGCGMIESIEDAAKLSQRDANRLGSALRNADYVKVREQVDGMRSTRWYKK